MKYLALLALAICTANAVIVSSAPRQNPWKIDNGTGAIYDITAFNDADCAIADIGINLGLISGSEILSYWNLEPSSRYWLMTNFGGALQPGQSTTSGIILYLDQSFDDSLSLPSLVPTVYGTNCVSSSPSPSPSSSPSTDSPTSSPTSTPTNVPTETPRKCEISSNLQIGSTWETEGVKYASYHILLTNNGGCPMTDYVTSFGLNGGEIIHSWNLESTLGGYAIKGFGELLHSGDTYGGAGFNVKGDAGTTLTPYGSNCEC